MDTLRALFERAATADTEAFLTAVGDAKASIRGVNLERRLVWLKLLNLLVARHHYERGHLRLLSSPAGFMMDVANGCNLGCPGCRNSFNQDLMNTIFVPMKRGVMKADAYSAFMDREGLFAFSGHFYNYSEPLLNKRFPEFVERADRLRIMSFTSSNLAIPKIDADAIVASGLKTLMVAVDGITPESYALYRRGGELAVVYENIRKIVEARRRLRSETPHLRWQFLVFRHNEHEVERAFEVAESIGVDEFNVSKGYTTLPGRDLPDIAPGNPPRLHDGTATVTFRPRPRATFTRDLRPERDVIEAAWQRDYLAEWRALPSVERGLVARDGAQRCDWLYVGASIDAMGEVTPCCIPPYHGWGEATFSRIQNGGRILDSDHYVRARARVTQPAIHAAYSATKVMCDACNGRPLPQVGLGAVGDWLYNTDGEMQRDISAAGMVGPLFGWSRHASSADAATDQSRW